MKLLKKDYKHGIIEFIPETIDDLYSLYRILKPGDLFRASTSRRVRKKKEDGRSDSGERLKMVLEIRIEEVSFGGFGDNLRVKGVIVAGREDLVSLGSYHTIALSTKEKARITKEEWATIEKKIIEEAEKSSVSSPILIVTLEEGSVCIALISQYQMKIINESRSAITRKFSDVKQHTTTMGTFFQDVLQMIQDAISQYKIDVLILAGPGFTSENFMDFVKKRNQVIAKKIQTVHVHTGGRVGLHEVLSKKLPEKIAEEQHIASETRLLDEFFKRIGQSTGNVAYGVKNVKQALEMGAVETLMISDDMLKIDDIAKRESIDSFVEQNSRLRGKTVIMSTMHDTGEQLSKLGGIAALLRYPISES